MRQRVSTFRYPVTIRTATGAASETVDAWVDTGALYSQFPASLLRRLGYEPNAMRRFRLADGSTSEAPIGDVSIGLAGEMHTVICIFGEEAGEMLLGATALEVFSLAADPVNETLVPVIAMRLGRRGAAPKA